MAIQITPVVNTNSFGAWVTKSNFMMNLFSSNTVTTDSTIAGAVTTGNAFVNGNFAVAALSANSFGGGNNSASANLTITSNTVYANGPFIYAMMTANTTSTNVVFNVNTFSISNATLISGNLQFSNNINVNGTIAVNGTITTLSNITSNGNVNVGGGINTNQSNLLGTSTFGSSSLGAVVPLSALSNTTTAVKAASIAGVGVSGTSNSNFGVSGTSNTSVGVSGNSISGTGVTGVSNATAVSGISNNTIGVLGQVTVGNTGTPLNSFGGYFNNFGAGYALGAISNTGPVVIFANTTTTFATLDALGNFNLLSNGMSVLTNISVGGSGTANGIEIQNTSITLGNSSVNTTITSSNLTTGNTTTTNLLVLNGATVYGNLNVNGAITSVGNAVASGSYIPFSNNLFSLGNTSHVWSNVYAQQFVGGNASLVSLTATANVIANGIYASLGSGTGQIVLTEPNHGVILRNDDTLFSILSTASGNTYGTWNSYTPFTYNLTTGAVAIDGTGQGVSLGGSLTLANGVINAYNLNSNVITANTEYGIALLGISNNGYGMAGVSNNGSAIYGQSTSGIGLQGATSGGTGIYAQATSGRGIYTSSSSGMGGLFLTSTGFGGIFEATSTGIPLQAQTASTNTAFQTFSNTGLSIQATGKGALLAQFSNATAIAFTFAGNGNLGIGNATPASALTVSGNGSFTAGVLVGANVVVNATTLFVGNSTVFTSINSTSISGVTLNANNSSYLGGQAPAYYANVTSYVGAFNGTTIAASSNAVISGTLFANGIIANNFDTYARGQIVMQEGTYSTIFRNDGSLFSLLSTASGNTNGTWNSLRPFSYNLATGVIAFDATGSGVSFGGNVVVGNTSTPSSLVSYSTSIPAIVGSATSASGLQSSSGTSNGVYGSSNSGVGVSGVSNTSDGLRGYSNSYNGITASSNSGTGGYFISNTGTGLTAISNSGAGIQAVSYGTGTDGLNIIANSGYAIRALSATGNLAIFSNSTVNFVTIDNLGQLNVLSSNLNVTKTINANTLNTNNITVSSNVSANNILLTGSLVAPITPIITYGVSHTLQTSDFGNMLYMNGAANSVITLPILPTGLVPGAKIIIMRATTANVNIANAAGVTLGSRTNNYNVLNTWGSISIVCVSANSTASLYVVDGNI